LDGATEHGRFFVGKMVNTVRFSFFLFGLIWFDWILNHTDHLGHLKIIWGGIENERLFAII
jgi:hypothetical protein